MVRHALKQDIPTMGGVESERNIRNQNDGECFGAIAETRYDTIYKRFQGQRYLVF